MLRLSRTILLFKVCEILAMGMTKNDVILQSNLLEANNYLRESMKQSFEFWHGVYNDSLINCPLVWKKAIESNSEIMEKITEAWKNNIKQNAEDQMQQFL
jgi:predicted nucleotide-binding protein (sugar kinase/HSP70/actin superfamily)